MNWYTILTTILWVVFGFLSLYIKQKTKLIEIAQATINTAEEHFTDVKCGGKRFQWVVEQLYNITPVPMRFIFTKEMIGTIVQKVFDYMQDFATKQLDKVFDKEKASE